SFNLPKRERKQHIEIVTSYSIQFVIYMRVGKILVTLPKAIADTLSVLAYPGNYWAIYTATDLTVTHLWIQSKRQKVPQRISFQWFVPIFFLASLIFEFLQITVEGSSINAYFVGIIIITLVMMFVYQNKAADVVYSLFMIIWAAGSGLLGFVKG